MDNWITITEFDKAEQYINEIPKFSAKHQMADTKEFLRFLTEASGFGMEALEGRVIHVAGTNGKGSVCAYLHHVLCEAGYRTGLFTSPHLVSIRERIRLSDGMISGEAFVRLFRYVMAEAEAFSDREGRAYYPSFFELLFFMAVVCFLENRTDYMILETGLGGRLDATNCIARPLITVITEIGLDHTEYLGDTVAQIAAEKAGIIKKGTPLVYWNGRKEAADVIRDCAGEKGVTAAAVSPEDIRDLKFHKKCIDFSIESRYYNNIRITLPDSALYQADNAALAFRALELIGRGTISREQILAGFYCTKWEGRMEEILPDVFLDGAHNADGIAAFLDTVARDECKGNRILLFGVMRDKYYPQMIKLLAQSRLFDTVILTRVNSIRTLEEAELRSLFATETAKETLYFYDAAKAFSDAVKRKKNNDKLYISGSLYLAGEIKALLRRNECK